MSDTVDVPEDQASEAILHHIKDAINTYIAYNERLGLPNLALTSVSEQIALRQRPRIIQEAQFLDNCDRHLTDIEAAIEFARGQLNTRRSGLHNFLHSPISLLPETVLRYIFALVAADDVQPITYGDSDRMYRSTLLSYAPSVHHISQVCLSWREISTEQRGLWTRITDSMSPNLCDMWLNRSWGAPLTVDLDFRFPLITGNPLRTHFHWALDSRHYDMQDILEQLRERENSDRIQALQIACKLAEPPGPTVAGPLHLHPAAAFHPPMAAAVPPPPAGAALGGAGIGGLNLPTTPWGRLPGLAAPILSGPVAVDVFPLLESLTLVNPGSGGSMGCGVLFTEISSRRFPRLENLILRNVIIGPLPTPLPSLRKLVLDGVCTTWGSLLDLLNGCPSLLSLALVNGGLGPGRESYYGNPVRLPCLLELLFQRTEPAMQFVQNLDMPVLHHLQLVYKRKPELAHVEEYLLQTVPSVRVLRLWTPSCRLAEIPAVISMLHKNPARPLLPGLKDLFVILDAHYPSHYFQAHDHSDSDAESISIFQRELVSFLMCRQSGIAGGGGGGATLDPASASAGRRAPAPRPTTTESRRALELLRLDRCRPALAAWLGSTVKRLEVERYGDRGHEAVSWTERTGFVPRATTI